MPFNDENRAPTNDSPRGVPCGRARGHLAPSPGGGHGGGSTAVGVPANAFTFCLKYFLKFQNFLNFLKISPNSLKFSQNCLQFFKIFTKF